MQLKVTFIPSQSLTYCSFSSMACVTRRTKNILQGSRRTSIYTTTTTIPTVCSSNNATISNVHSGNNSTNYPKTWTLSSCSTTSAIYTTWISGTNNAGNLLFIKLANGLISFNQLVHIQLLK